MLELEHLPDPADDTDEGYGDEEEVHALPEKVDLEAMRQLVSSIRRESAESEPEDFYGSSDDDDPGGDSGLPSRG